jgi:hypothetical protein
VRDISALHDLLHMAAGIVQFLETRGLKLAGVLDGSLLGLALPVQFFQVMEPVEALLGSAFKREIERQRGGD